MARRVAAGTGDHKCEAAIRPPTRLVLPESREENRFDAENRRSDCQQRAVYQALRDPARGAVRECSEGGRPASEGGSRETLWRISHRSPMVWSLVKATS